MLLDWQFRVAKMGRPELEATMRALDAEEHRPMTMDEVIAEATTAAAIYNGEAVLRRSAAASDGLSDGRRTRMATVDLGAYYAALDASEAEARERADRAEIRGMCERRLAHFERRDELGHHPVASPLKAYMAARENPGATG